ncbi:glycosyltransferase family 2 protein [Verminephrobacter eiseniae]|nr:glycosyltransferase family 2 protein [Verminephrobacter eiseniae]MCW5294299.1 glycosyltransferase family 2 protein [Verminephrobacter eiseniae]MCW8184967.1 glycosyltransferase family 2 protein [Verminephrobacter eiseniae]MCW8225849.1 glycosyltransferase family 2 protein [Verminephrobacter eiseniae]MCW8234090.1 glycosyltransferase family 2 protein [Verminephrobacter eiseniae]
MNPGPSMSETVAVIPCYNHPQTIGFMVDAVRAHQLAVIVVDDGSDAVCAEVLDGLARRHGATLTLLRLEHNLGKGGAMMAGLRHALSLGYTHALQIDADGQHDVADIPKFLALSDQRPDAVVYGVPLYDDCVPKARLYGRYATHIWVWINTLSLDIRDSMCGFRVYPLEPVVRLIDQTRLGRRMDFDTELLVRLHWQGVRLTHLPTRVRYPVDGLSHFKLVSDNMLISCMHARLLAGMLLRLPLLLWRKVAW